MTLYEEFMRDSQDGQYAQNQLKAISDYSTKISDLIEMEEDLPSWVQTKLAVIQHDMDEIYHAVNGAKFFDRSGNSITSETEFEPADSFGYDNEPKGDLPSVAEFEDDLKNGRIAPDIDDDIESDDFDIPEFEDDDEEI